MKYLTILVFPLILCASGLFAQSGRQVIRKYESGQIKSEGRAEDNKREGYWVYYYENGQKMSEGTFQDGVRNGLWIIYYPTGSVKSKGKFMKSGEEAVKHGEWIFYHKNASKSKQGRYKYGQPIGIWQMFDEQGEIIEERDFH